MDSNKILDTLADLKRRVTAPWRRGETPLELRKTLLDELMERTVPVAPGQRVLAFDRVRIELSPSDPEDAFVLRQALPTWRQEMLEAIAKRLTEIGCSGQHIDLQLALIDDEVEANDEIASDAEAGHAGGVAMGQETEASASADLGSHAASPGGRYALFFERSERKLGELGIDELAEQPVDGGRTGAHAGSPAALREGGAAGQPDRDPASPGMPSIEIEVLRGKAERDLYRFARAKIYVGRTAEVLDGHGRLRRRNHLAFDDHDEDSATVSREHARLLFRPDPEDSGSGAYWLVDERSSHGTRVFRDGRSFDVSPRDRRGVLIKPGDEIYFGRTVVRCSFPG